jgi:hypothetical protein
MLTESYLVIYENQYNNVPTHYCPLTFAVKSEFLFETIQILGVIISSKQLGITKT